MTPASMVPGERGVAQMPVARSPAVRLQRVLAIGLVTLIGGGVLVWYYRHLSNGVHTEAAIATAASRTAAASEMKLPVLGVAPAAMPPPATLKSADGETGTIDDAPAAQGRAAPHPPAEATDPAAGYGWTETRGPASSPVLARPVAQPAVEVPSLVPSSTEETQAGEVSMPSLARGFVAGPAADRPEPLAIATPATEAALGPGRRWLLPKGSFLDCTLETAIDTSLGGLVTCLLATDVYGADGRVVLLERGTRLLGDVRSDVRAGQTRVAIVWTEARTPTGVIAALGGPATDALGRTGLPGAVDRHSGERFGAAVLLSTIDGAISAVAARARGGGGAVIYNAQGSRDIATEVLRNTINIPPTIRVPPGARILVAVIRDVDFGRVYGLVGSGRH